jgi:hypothetical protein
MYGREAAKQELQADAFNAQDMLGTGHALVSVCHPLLSLLIRVVLILPAKLYKQPCCCCSCCCFCSCPTSVRNGHIKRITDQDIQSSVLEIMSSNVNTTFITCPADPAQTLGIKLPFLVMIIKNLKKYFSFEVTVLDDKGVKRRFRASNYQVRSAVLHVVQEPPVQCS